MSVYFVTSVFRFILNIVSTNENYQMNTDAFGLQEIKRVGQSFYFFDIFYSVILAATDIVFYLSFVIINGNVLK